jgi:uncharacterized membrane protein
MIASIITLFVALFASAYFANHPRSLALWHRWSQRFSPTLCVAIAALLYCVVLGGAAILRHRSFNSNSLDMGLMDQIIWNSAQGRLLEQTFFTGYPTSFLGDHFSPTLVLLAPLYWLRPGPEALVIVQAACIAASAFLLFRVAVELSGEEWIAASLAAMLLLHPLVHDAALFDFHPDALGMAFLALGLYGITYKRWGVAAAGWLLSTLSKEEIALYWIVIGLFFLVVDERQRLYKAAFLAINALWLYLAVAVFIPYFQSESASGFLFFDRYAFWGSNVGEVFQTIINRPLAALRMLLLPDRIGGIGMMVLPVLLYLIRGRWATLILLLPLGINSVSDLMVQHNYRLHYSLLPIIIIVYAAMRAIVSTQRSDRLDALPILRRATLFLSVASVMLFLGVSQLGVRLPGTMQRFWLDDRDRLGHRLVQMIPAQASVIAQNKLVPHLSQRQYVTVLPRSLASPADYYFVDLRSPIEPLTPEVYTAEVKRWLAMADYGVLHLEDGYLLLSRGIERDMSDVQRALQMVDQLHLPVAAPAD